MKKKICPLTLQGRSKAELAYIRGAMERGDEETILELTCLEEKCAWYVGNGYCSIRSIVEALWYGK